MFELACRAEEEVEIEIGHSGQLGVLLYDDKYGLDIHGPCSACDTAAGSSSDGGMFMTGAIQCGCRPETETGYFRLILWLIVQLGCIKVAVLSETPIQTSHIELPNSRTFWLLGYPLSFAPCLLLPTLSHHI